MTPFVLNHGAGAVHAAPVSDDRRALCGATARPALHAQPVRGAFDVTCPHCAYKVIRHLHLTALSDITNLDLRVIEEKPMDNVVKHQLAVGTVMTQLAQKGIYAWPHTLGSKVRLHTKDGHRRIRVTSRFTGTWQLQDWPTEIADDSYDTVILVDFTEPAPLLYIVPGDVFRKDVEENATPTRPGGHHAITQVRFRDWLNRWDVLEATT